jgi:hypothetical protein
MPTHITAKGTMLGGDDWERPVTALTLFPEHAI